MAVQSGMVPVRTSLCHELCLLGCRIILIELHVRHCKPGILWYMLALMCEAATRQRQGCV